MDRLLIPDDPLDIPNTTWSTVIEAQALFKALTDDGQKHFHQAADTPFVSGPIAEILGPFADNGYSNAILNGTFDLSTLDEMVEVHDIIKGMRYPHPTAPTPPIDIMILDEQFCDAMKHTRERTSSSPSGQHYGHYGTLLRDPNLLASNSSLANFCFHWGVTLQWWEKVI